MKANEQREKGKRVCREQKVNGKDCSAVSLGHQS